VKENVLINARYGTFYFNRDESGKVVSFKLAAGRVKNLLFTRK